MNQRRPIISYHIILYYIILYASLLIKSWRNNSVASYNSSSRPSDARLPHRSSSTLLQVTTCSLIGTKPLPKPILTYCQIDPMEHISLRFYVKHRRFHSRKIFKMPSAKCPNDVDMKKLPHSSIVGSLGWYNAGHESCFFYHQTSYTTIIDRLWFGWHMNQTAQQWTWRVVLWYYITLH